jgi:hypothetical protein
MVGLHKERKKHERTKKEIQTDCMYKGAKNK